ncbi:RecA family profile 1 domain-containing protein [Plasmodiophora brassicae]
MDAFEDDIGVCRKFGLDAVRKRDADAARRAPKPKTAFQLLKMASTRHAGIIAPAPVIPGIVTELCGASSAGKTQACMTFAVDTFVMTRKPVIFVDTENSLSTARLLQIAASRYPEQLGCPARLTELMSSVIVIAESDPQSFRKLVSELDQEILYRDAAAVVVDSLAAICRHMDQARMHSYLSDIAMELKNLSEKYDIACLVTNQVSSTFRSDRDSVLDSPVVTNVRPALGLPWEHSVNVRYILELDAATKDRFLTIKKSPVSADCWFRYQITESGITIAN